MSRRTLQKQELQVLRIKRVYITNVEKIGGQREGERGRCGRRIIEPHCKCERTVRGRKEEKGGKRERGRREAWKVDGSERVVKITQLISSKPLYGARAQCTHCNKQRTTHERKTPSNARQLKRAEAPDEPLSLSSPPPSSPFCFCFAFHVLSSFSCPGLPLGPCCVLFPPLPTAWPSRP